MQCHNYFHPVFILGVSLKSSPVLPKDIPKILRVLMCGLCGGMERIEWPACSPNLNNTTTLAHLQQMLVEEWDAIPQQCVTKLVRRRCQAFMDVYSSSRCFRGTFVY
uniref:Uncharacterized protein n=1 Tax=Maylandia zebra TaxID=106582 RepID=A0A3P9CW80_9CICH